MTTQDNSDAPLAFVIGCTGAIGRAMSQQLRDKGWRVVGFSRTVGEREDSIHIDLTDEKSIREAAQQARKLIESGNKHPSLIVVTAGVLHDAGLRPEKALREITTEQLTQVFQVNSFGPTLVMAHFLPLLPRKGRSVFAALSARVGSISDNRLGGWYSYRASKAALNMMIRCAAIELARKNKDALVVGLHPGTVDSALSKPFQGSAQKLFTPDQAAENLLAVLDGLTSAESGELFAWDGQRIAP